MDIQKDILGKDITVGDYVAFPDREIQQLD
jgi:hypothetical protein